MATADKEPGEGGWAESVNTGTIANNGACDQRANSDADPLPPASRSAVEPDSPVPNSNRDLSTVGWSVVAILLSCFWLMHLGVMLCFGTGSGVSPAVAPAALLLSLAAGDWLARREGLRGPLRIAPPAIALAAVSLGLFLAASFFDLSWDGLWYQQTAVYQMAHGWNPLREPMRGFSPGHVESLLRHYSKEPWYVALALFKTTHNIEWAKAGTWPALAAMFFAVFAAGLDFGMRRRAAAIIAALVSLNPVVVCEAASYLVDGLLISFLACFVAALFRWFRRPGLLVLVVMMASAILCINTKLTGLVYLCFACAAGGLYVLIKRRDLLLRYAAVQVAALLLGVGAFGFNPYVTNTVHRGNPFYPLLGSAAYPGSNAQKEDPIDRYETPRNMVGRSRFYRLAYALFGRPGAQPLYQGNHARLMWPFDVGWKDFHIFYFHEVRISGFGPLFSGAFIVSLFLMGAALVRPGVPRVVLLLSTGAIVASLLISKHTWWARLGPQLWWLPIIAVIAGVRLPGWRAARWTAWGLAALLLVNATLVGFAHFRWEIEATRKTREQMAFLRGKSGVQVSMGYFGEPYGERLRTAGVEFTAVNRVRATDSMELMSVSPGYPGAVRARVPQN
jgi:hypothetical protein